MASGVPIVQPRRGAATEIVETTGGGILVAPDDPDALADGLLELMADPGRRRLLGDAGYDGVRAHYSSTGCGTGRSRSIALCCRSDVGRAFRPGEVRRP